MIVGAWNIQRAAGIASASDRAQARAQWAALHVERWIITSELADNPLPDLMILTEVSQGGGEMAAYFMNRLPAYEARFVEAGDRNNNVSPCSFLVLWRRAIGNVRIVPTGGHSKRPMVKVYCPLGLVAGVHIIASNREKAEEEILDALTELDNETDHATMLIGDMNFPWNNLTDRGFGGAASLLQQGRDVGFRPIAPGPTPTYGGYDRTTGQLRTSTLDYAWFERAITTVAATPPIPGYAAWTTIDHAPIAYDVQFPGEEMEVEE
jgi:hypothetical protein